MRARGVITLGLLALLSATRPGYALSEDEIQRSFDVEAGGKLDVDVEDGDIEVVAHDEPTVVVRVLREVEAASRDLEAEILAAHRVQLSQRGDKIRIKARTQRSAMRKHRHRFSVRVVVAVPHKFDADLTTVDGDITAIGLDGSFEARSSDGTMLLRQLAGDVDLQTSDGDVVLEGCAGGLRVQTSDGDLRLTGIGGAVRARASDGDILLSLAADKPAELSASDGNIDIRVDPAAALSFDLRVADGRIRSDLALMTRAATTYVSGHLAGDLNGGGASITARTADGSITLAGQ